MECKADISQNGLLQTNKPWYVYMLYSSEGQTYIGATIDVNRRLRQHNCEIKGGAKATKMRVIQGQIWNRACYVEGFPDKKAALQFEWAWKHISTKKSLEHRSLSPVERRIQALYDLLSMEKPTSTALPYKDYPSGLPNVIWE
jgi:predicted GIY-YIG superfamily endonuclease